MWSSVQFTEYCFSSVDIYDIIDSYTLLGGVGGGLLCTLLV